MKRATALLRYWDIRKPISIHALMKRATVINMPKYKYIEFQSTPS